MKLFTQTLLIGALLAAWGVSAAGAAKIGVASAVNPSAIGTPPGGAPQTMVLGKKVVFNERIKTSAGGLVQLLLLDGSAFTIGPNSEVVIDKFVYDPDKKTGQMVANVLKGAFRFVGGRLSKGKDAVTIRTKVATIGVRGGIVSGLVGRGRGKDTFNFLFGDEMTVGTNCRGRRCGKTQRVYQNGNSVDVGGGGGLKLRRTSSADILAMHSALSGRLGLSGGARRRPTNTIGVQSGLPKQNSAKPPSQTARPPRRAIKSTPIVEVETEIVNPGANNGDQKRDDLSDKPRVMVRILETDVVLTTGSGKVINNPGAAGLLGGDNAGSVYTEDALLFNNRAFVSHNGQVSSVPYQESLSPVTAGISASEFLVNDGVSYDGKLMLGAGYVTEGGHFIYYQLFHENLDGSGNGLGTRNLDDSVIALGGTPTPSFDASASGGTLHIYQIGRDLRQTVSAPFTLSTIFSDYSSLYSTELKLLEQGGGTIGVYADESSSRTVTLQGNLMIDGEGTGQRSFASLHVSFLQDDGAGDGPKIAAPNRGSFRAASDGPVTAMGGLVSSVKGPEGNHFFGSAGMDNFVLGTEPDAKESFSYEPIDGSILAGTEDNHFGSYHILARTSDVAPGAQASRSSRTLTGYGTGLMERSGSAPLALRSGNGGEGMEILFNGNRNTMWAQMGLSPASGMGTGLYTLAFGSDPTRDVTDMPGSAFIDDDTYGANGNASLTKVHESGYSDAGFPNSHAASPQTYIFGSELIPVTDFLPAGVSLCACKFLEWGYWGGKVSYDDPANTGSNKKDYFHLGTWVAGDVIKDLSPFTGSASYNGHAIGNVSKVSGGVTHNYLAAGSYNLTFDFGSRTGSASISNFDGLTFVAPSVAMSTVVGQEHSYNAALTGTSGSGSLNGAFVNGPAVGTSPAGTIGQFNFSDTGYTAVGIVAAQQ